MVGVADISREAAEGFSSEFDSPPPVYTNHRKLLRDEKPDLVIACLWTRLHLPVFRDCVKAGARAYHSEKPMAATWGDCLKMARLAEKSGCQLTFCHQRRFRKGNLLARRLIAEGRLGEIKRMDLYSPPNLLDCGTHTFDQALSFNNEKPATWAMGAVDVNNPIKWFDVQAESMAVGTIVFANGVRANIQVGGPDKDMQTGVRVIGTRGFLEVAWDGEFGAAVLYDDPDWKAPPIDDPQEDTMVAVVREVIDSLRARRQSQLDYRKTLRATEIIFALYESVRRRARVELPIEIRDNPFLCMLEEGKEAT